MKKRTLIINIITIAAIVAGVGYILFSSSGSKFIESQQCISFDSLIKAEYETCYDSPSQNVFLRVDRFQDDYSVIAIDISLNDSGQARSFSSSEFPVNNAAKAYKIPSFRNPEEIRVFAELKNSGNFMNLCNFPKVHKISNHKKAKKGLIQLEMPKSGMRKPEKRFLLRQRIKLMLQKNK